MYLHTVKGQIFAVVLISLCSLSTIFPRNQNHRDQFTTLMPIVNVSLKN